MSENNRVYYHGGNNPETHKYFDPHLSYGEGVIVCDRPIRPGNSGTYLVACAGGVADCHPMGDPRQNTRRSTNYAQESGSSTVWGIRWWVTTPTET